MNKHVLVFICEYALPPPPLPLFAVAVRYYSKTNYPLFCKLYTVIGHQKEEELLQFCIW